jgi:rhodanese-related sulfurtransferase
MKQTRTAFLGMFTSLCLLSAAASAEGNRYDQPRLYHSEVSASEAYRLTQHNHGNAGRASHKPVLLDVRSIPEYVAGHPEGALHVPYPRIHETLDNVLSAEDKATLLIEAVQAAIPDKDTPILVLCKTGSRSIAASNLLAEAGYTQVRNIWEGFEGRTKTDTAGNALDLNNNGVVGDAGDLDGWKNFASLPYSTQLHPKLIYKPFDYLYYQ